jgi:hypothetical protein
MRPKDGAAVSERYSAARGNAASTATVLSERTPINNNP